MSSEPHAEVVLSGSIPGEILRDVVRTYQANSFFKEGGYGRNILQNVLCALVKSRPDVGYCQVQEMCFYFCVYFLCVNSLILLILLLNYI